VHLPVAAPAVADAPLLSDDPSAALAVRRLRGDIDLANAASVQRSLLQQIWTTSGNLTLDMSEVEFFGSSGLAVLAAADSEIRSRGGRLVIIDAPPEILRLLELVGVPRPSGAPGDGRGVRPRAAA
jgi:anti-sigma B factor antagonist